MGSSLPRLDTIRDNPEPPPVWRARNSAIAEVCLHASKFLLEKRSSWNLRALRRRPCAETAFARARLKILLRFAPRQFVDTSFDSELPLEFRPVKHNGRARIPAKVGSLAAVVVGVEDEAAAADAAIQDDAHRWASVARRGRERHRFGERLAGLLRLAKPLPEQRERIVGVFNAAPPGR